MAFGPKLCAHCGSPNSIHEHHLIPRVNGGKDGPTVWLCSQHHGEAHQRFVPTDHANLIRIGKEKARANRRFAGGKIPFGFTVEEGRLVEHPKQQQAIVLAKELRSLGASFREVLAGLKEFGQPISMGALHRLLRPSDSHPAPAF